MAMISGPYTDAVVKMLMGEERRLSDGDILKNPRGQYGVFDRGSLWICDSAVLRVSAGEFDAAHSKKLRFPETFAGGFRFVAADGNIWIPELTAEEKEFLKNVGYVPAPPDKTLARITAAAGEKHHGFYAVSCKTGVWDGNAAKKIALCLERFGD